MHWKMWCQYDLTGKNSVSFFFKLAQTLAGVLKEAFQTLLLTLRHLYNVTRLLHDLSLFVCRRGREYTLTYVFSVKKYSRNSVVVPRIPYTLVIVCC